jgi:hypothetical protein
MIHYERTELKIKTTFAMDMPINGVVRNARPVGYRLTYQSCMQKTRYLDDIQREIDHTLRKYTPSP